MSIEHTFLKIKTIYDTMSNVKQKKVDEAVKNLDLIVTELANLNMELNDRLMTDNNGSEAILSSDFQTKMDSISDDALTVYVSKAQLYKVYPYEMLDAFQNDDNTIYRKPEYGPVHEVVRDLHPQKLTIVVNDDLNEDKILYVKKLLVDFIKKNPVYTNFDTKQILVYKYDSKTEFLISCLLLANITEKEKMVEIFIKFLKKMDDNDIHHKIVIKHPACDELDGARFYKLPSAKQPLGNYGFNLADQLVSISGMPSNINNNVFIKNSTIIIQNNSHNTNNNTNINVNTDDSLANFYKYIYDTKPAWYKENKSIEFSIIEQAYRKYTGDKTKTKIVMSRQMNGKLFNSIPGTTRCSKKTLVSYDELKELF